MRLICVTLGLAAMLCSCAKPTAETKNQNSSKKIETLKSFDGWNSIKFGMSFDDAFIAESGISWEAKSFRDCRDQIPVKGCSLWPDEDRSYAPLYAGVALLPLVQFNLAGAVTDIGLVKMLKSITPAQCERAHGRVMDQLIKDWGNRKPSKHEVDRIFRKSPAGTTFGRSKASAEGIFVMDIERFNELPDGRHISLLTTFIPKSEYSPSNCHIGVYFDGPKSLARAPTEASKDEQSLPDAQLNSEDQSSPEEPSVPEELPAADESNSADELSDSE